MPPPSSAGSGRTSKRLQEAAAAGGMGGPREKAARAEEGVGKEDGGHEGVGGEPKAKKARAGGGGQGPEQLSLAIQVSERHEYAAKDRWWGGGLPFACGRAIFDHNHLIKLMLSSSHLLQPPLPRFPFVNHFFDVHIRLFDEANQIKAGGYVCAWMLAPKPSDRHTVDP